MDRPLARHSILQFGDMMLPDSVQAVLRQEGWTPERRIPIQHWVSQLVNHGFSVLPEAESILENMGELQIIPTKTSNDAFLAEETHFDPIAEVISEFDVVAFWQEQLGTPLTPLGMLYPSESILLIGANGHVYAAWGNIIWECGDSFADALENTLVFAKRKAVLRRVDSDGKLIVLD